MATSTAGRLTALVAVGLSALGFASVASGSTPLGCRASLAAVRLAPLPTVEPYVANRPGSPCATATNGITSGAVLGGLPGTNALLAGPAGAFTYSSDSADTKLGPVPFAAGALASIHGATITTPAGSLIAVGPADAQVSYTCVAGKVVGTASSTLAVLKINGTEIAIPSGVHR